MKGIQRGEETGRRIVVTGMGAVTPLAANVEESWSRLLAGRSGIRRLPNDVVRDLPTKIGGVVPSLEEDAEAGFDPNTVFAPKDQRKVDRFILFGLAAAEEALAQARWAPVSEANRLRTATIIASGIGGFPAITEAVRTVDLRGVRRLSPFTVASFLVNLAGTERFAKSATTDGRKVANLLDDEVMGFGLQVRDSGRKTFTLDYTFEGRCERYFIGDYPAWVVAAAPDEPRRLKREIDGGTHPPDKRDERWAGRKF